MTTPTPPGQPPVIPEGAYVGTAGQHNSLAKLSDLTEGGAKAQMQGTVAPSFNKQRDEHWGFVTDLIAMFTGNYAGTKPPFIDGQLAINDRMELLGKSAYCSAYMESNLRLGPGRNRALPFNGQIGPNQDAVLVQVTRAHPESGSASRSEWCIRLDRAGLWQANASFVHRGDGYGAEQAEIVVLRPDLTVYSVTTLPGVVDKSGASGLNGGVPVSLFKTFVTPESGYYVQVRWMFTVLVAIRTVAGGARQSQLSVVQWSDDIANANTNDDAVGTIDDTA